MSSPKKRRDVDVMKLMMSDYEVSSGDSGSVNDFYVKFHGPKDSLYEGGVWKIHVTLPIEYPYKSPSIGFCNSMYHPNVDESSGSVCLDVINQTWSPMFDLLNIFKAFLPQLLLYPNAADPLNVEAAALMLKDKKAYDKRVRNMVQKYAMEDVNMEDASSDEKEDSFSAMEDDEFEEFSDIDDLDMDDL
mmetsp:Transcript_23298/g.32581  ORF Transcript_23298/g.32581 Transcript_23298/m.32581 type:complete len:189 (-) Transcript_23298:346-912(-)|eukprot:CAMPEP_0185255456 /NCGR_PEP_ID=MMETSP1359-20130426/4487_1 /TAXON_ID=552665 /ORGANISM="Bigelowiella longifila, Strain CCMP242" /LENGTH=188 /DNA_ID=CAMNT_0027839357 /DNA_START=397 /DNA_END=963 /DNA_ORIENTATION=+